MHRLMLQFTAELQLKGYSANSIQNHRLDLLRFKEWLDAKAGGTAETLSRLTAAELADYQSTLATRLKPRTVSRHLSTLKLFFQFLESAGILTHNPMEQVVFPKVWTDVPAMLTPAEVSQLLAAPDEAHYLGLRDRALLELLYSSGLKVHELIALDTDSLELELGFVRVTGRRGERMVPLTDTAMTLLTRYLTESRPGRILHPDEHCLFPGRNGTRISRVAVWQLIKKYAAQAGVKKNFNPRALRHAFAIHLLLGGMDLDGIKMLFGYRELDAAALYAHVNRPDYRATYNAHHPLAKENPVQEPDQDSSKTHWDSSTDKGLA